MSEGISAAPLSASFGPVDRESFFEAQRRHRRVARWLSLVVGIGMALVSIPLASILFPLLFLAFVVVLDVINKIAPVPDVIGAYYATGGHFAEGPHWLSQSVVIGIIVVAPGTLLMLALWRGLWRIFHDGRLADVSAKLGARPPNVADLEEKQLANVVEEMAIAAGIDPPKLLVFDAPAVNATVLGSSGKTATVLVSRRLLDTLDRDATQGVIGHLIAGIANGDLRLAMEAVTGFAAIGLTRELLKAPLSRDGRAVVGEMIRFLLWPNAESSLAQEGAFLERLLADDPGSGLDDADAKGLKKVMFWVLFPVMMAFAMFNLVTFAANLLFLSPWLTLLLRSRRYLMDATAVQLTRNPDGLKRALGQLAAASQGKLPPLREGGLMFVVPARFATAGDTAPMGLFFGIYPGTEKRWDRVAAMGTGAVRRPSLIHWQDLKTPLGLLVGGLVLLMLCLVVALIPLLLFLIVACTMLSLGVGMAWVMIIGMPLHWLLR